MKKRNNKSNQTEKKQPIIDGDARPDLPTDISDAQLKRGKKKLTAERGADINSLEDYKDAK